MSRARESSPTLRRPAVSDSTIRYERRLRRRMAYLAAAVGIVVGAALALLVAFASLGGT